MTEDEVAQGYWDVEKLQCSHCSALFRSDKIYNLLQCFKGCKNRKLCKGSFRFPRTRDIVTTMKKRYGRCTEMGQMFAFIIGLMGLRNDCRMIEDWDGDHISNEVLIGDKWVPVNITTRKRQFAEGAEKARIGKYNWVAAYDECKAIDVTDTYDVKSKPGEREERRASKPEYAPIFNLLVSGGGDDQLRI
jgi:hypothetical protein